MRLRLAAVVFAAASYALPASAGEAEVRQAIDDLARLYAPAEGATLAFSFSGRARITSQNSVHAVVLPALELHYQGSVLQLGDFAVSLREQNAGQMAFEAKFPPSVLMRLKDLPEAARITLRDPRLSGSFDPRLFAFTALEFRSGPVELRAGANNGPMTIKLGSYMITHAAGATAERNWTTQTTNSVSRVEFGFQGFAATMADSTSTHRVVDIDLAAYGALAKANGIDPLVYFPQFGPLDRLSTRLAAVMGGTSVGRIETEARGSNLTLSSPDGLRLALSAVFTNFTVSEIAATRASLRLLVKLEKLSGAESFAHGLAPLVPHTIALELDLKNLPVGEFITLVEQSRGLGLAPSPDTGELLQRLTKGGPVTARLQPSRIDGKALGIGLSGSFVTAPQAAFGGQGALIIEVSGLPQAIQLLRQQPNDPQALQTSAFLMLLQAMGKSNGLGKRADGPLSYELTLDPAGRVMLNGVDFSALLSALRPPAR